MSEADTDTTANFRVRGVWLLHLVLGLREQRTQVHTPQRSDGEVQLRMHLYDSNSP